MEQTRKNKDYGIMSKFIIICGGTGGHLVPGIAIGKALLKAGHEVSFVISTKNVDAVLMKKYSDLHVIKTPGCAFSKNPIKFFKFLAELTKSIRFGIKTLKDGNYDLVMSFGGFNSLGFSIAALMLKIPLILHEANRKAGKATRLLGKFAKRIYVPYGVKIPRARVTRVKYAGYPLRDEIVKLPQAPCKEAFGFSPDSNLILILGGSQGAAALNEWASNIFPKLAKKNMDILCVCGPGKQSFKDAEEFGSDGKSHKIKFIEFCDKMGEAMSAADLCVARAGAGTIAELARTRLPSVIIPYPYAADNHQLENARCFEKQGACVMLEQKYISNLENEVVELMENERIRNTMLKNLERVDDTNDMSKIVTDLEKLAKRKDK